MKNDSDFAGFYCGLFARDLHRAVSAGDKISAQIYVARAADNAKRAFYFDRVAHGESR
jgi:hypothetical protein